VEVRRDGGRRVSSGLGRDALRRLSLAGGEVEVAIDELINDVAALGSQLVVVLVSAERFFADELATVRHMWLLLRLARVRLRGGRLADAEATLRSAREALGEMRDSSPVPPLAGKVDREVEAASDCASSGELLEQPGEAEQAVLQLRARGLSNREIGEICSSRRIRSGHAFGRSLGVH